MSNSDASQSSAVPLLIISRTFAAPPAQMFKAWGSAEHMQRWFSPDTYTVPHAEIDFRPGGVCAICMRSAEGRDFWSRGTYLEISPPDRLVFTSGIVDGGVRRFTAHTTVTFEQVAEGTRMTVRQAYDLHDPSFRFAVDGAPEGWRTTLDKLEREVARISTQDVTAGGNGNASVVARSVVHDTFSIERVFEASAAAVFHALTDPTAKARWFVGGADQQIVERHMDVRPGGTERLKGHWKSGLITTFDAIYLEVITNERLIYTYQMRLDDRKISVSLAVIELMPIATSGAPRTRLKVTEQGAFLDGYDDAGSRAHGTGVLLDQLGTSLGPSLHQPLAKPSGFRDPPH